jgi:hypothetical protein
MKTHFDKYTIGIVGFLIAMVGLGSAAFFTQESSPQVPVQDLAPKAEFSVSVENPNNTLYPSWFIFSNADDLEQSGEVVVSNLTNTQQALHIYGADYIPTNTGDFGLSREEDEQKSIGKWLIPELSDVILEPYESRAISYVIDVEGDVDFATSYAGAIVVEQQKPSDEDPRILLKFRVGTRVFVQLDGSENTILTQYTS